MEQIVSLIDQVLMNPTNEDILEQVAEDVNELMGHRELFVW